MQLCLNSMNNKTLGIHNLTSPVAEHFLLHIDLWLHSNLWLHIDV